MRSVIRAAVLAGNILALALAGGCTVRPLLATQPGVAGAESALPALAAISVLPVDTRHAQEVRNHLIFLLRGGGAEPAAPRYQLSLSVGRTVTSAALIQVGGEDEPSAGTVSLTGTYTLRETASGETIARGRQEVSASFDRPPQEYAVIRAQRDAEDRAARELAELIRLGIAQAVAGGGT
ncbi:LPS assembly lipoprotein LptE [Chelativorans sp. Marseille-P2723]|uniref:LPS assembly lipoprotein LptE n=1 Tax=Chelativorans sp. Marseille-P2723 TaxID=2709133 RepID=UPI001570E55E|nr:LPS assembly lipoprotein LptE [Chelativorans sp. Marseille-P2723]